MSEQRHQSNRRRLLDVSGGRVTDLCLDTPAIDVKPLRTARQLRVIQPMSPQRHVDNPQIAIWRYKITILIPDRRSTIRFDGRNLKLLRQKRHQEQRKIHTCFDTALAKRFLG